ncbi:MAG: rcc01693 family protein [Roseicyclus sp.]
MSGRPGFDWPALMRAGLGDLGLAPEAFWRLSPAEFLTLLGGAGPAPMGRSAFEALAARFPDMSGAAEGTDRAKGDAP